MPKNSGSSPLIFDSEEILGEYGGKESFAPYADYLLAENQKINLVSRETSPGDLYRLIADCLIPLKTDELAKIIESRSKTTLLDIGSGGGLPGIPLALALRSVGIEPHLIMVERTGKKARFLERTLETLGLSGQIIGEDFLTSVNSGALKEMTSSIDLASLRWVKPDSRLLSHIAATLKPTGRFVYYAALPPNIAIQTDWSVSTLSYKLIGDARDSRTLNILIPG